MTAITREQQRPLRIRDEFTSPMLMGGIGFAVMLAALVAWANFTMISGAVITHGQTVVHGKPKVVQTLDGGEVKEILVQDGDRVSEGQVLLRLDATLPKVNLDIAMTKLAETLARQARLKAEAGGLPSPVFAYDGLPFDPPQTGEQEEAQRQIFVTRAELLRGRRDQFAQTKAEVGAQAQGLDGQIAAVREQVALLAKDQDNIDALVEQGLARQGQLSELKRSDAELAGRLAALEAEKSRMMTSLRDAEIELLQSERTFREEVMTELREVTALVDELTLEIVNRTAQLERIEIRAPASGIVHELQVTTVGGVLPQGATILQVIPLEDGVDFELRIDAKSIDQVFVGQRARVILSAFSRHTTPELHGEVASVSPGAIEDKVSGLHYYRAQLKVSDEEMARLGEAVLMPGMPVEAYLATGERSVMTYMLEPLTTEFRRAFREQ